MNVQILWRLAFLMVFNGHSIFVWITVLTINRCGYILFDWWWPAVDTTESVGDDNYPLREVIRTNQYNDREIWTMLIRTSHWSGQRVFCGLRRVFSPLVLIQGGLWRARQIWWPLQRKSSAIHSPFSKEVLAKRVRGDLCCEGVFPPARNVWLWSYVRFSWHETFREHFFARLSQLFHLRAWQALYFARDAKTLPGLARDEVVSEVIFVIFCGRRSIWWTWTMFWADLNSSRHRFVNIRYFSACHDFAWQVQDSGCLRRIFFWGRRSTLTQNSRNLMVLSCIVFHIFNVHVSWWMHNWFSGAVLILISLAQPSPHSVCVWKSWKDVELLPLIASLLVVWFIGFAVSYSKGSPAKPRNGRSTF